MTMYVNIYESVSKIWICISPYIIKRFRRRRRHLRVKNRRVWGGGGDASGGRIILSSPKARNCWACSKFELVRLQRFWVLGDFGALRSPISPSIDIYKTMYTHTSWPEVIWKGRALIS